MKPPPEGGGKFLVQEAGKPHVPFQPPDVSEPAGAGEAAGFSPSCGAG
jgi:hypothetical protein